MARYKDYSYEQGQFIPVDFISQIREGSFEYALNHIIDNELDLSCFDEEFKNDLTGAPAYDPRIMLKIVFYAYSLGIIHSRKIARECEVNIIFMALSAYTKPHFTTIADFINSMGEKATKLFADVILLCDNLGLIGKNMFAIDGCKISSNAGKEWSGKIEDFKRKKQKMEEEVSKLLKHHIELDDKNEELQDQLEKEKQAIKNYKKKINKLYEFIKENDDRKGVRDKAVQSNITDNESAKMKSGHGVIQGYNGIAGVDDKHQIILEAQVIGSVNERESVGSMIEGIEKNLNDSFKDGTLSKTIVTADTGFNSEEVLEILNAKGVDAYIPDPHFRKRDPKLIGREKYDRPFGKKHETRDKGYFKREEYFYDKTTDQFICPAGEYLYKAGVQRKVGDYIFQRYNGRDSKCPNCNLRSKCIQGKKSKIKQYNVQIEDLKDKTFSNRMKKKIDTLKGRFIYSRRMGTVEPVFAHICHTLKLQYFTMRGKEKANTQWKLYTTLHNMKKIFRFSPLFA